MSIVSRASSRTASRPFSHSPANSHSGSKASSRRSRRREIGSSSTINTLKFGILPFSCFRYASVSESSERQCDAGLGAARLQVSKNQRLIRPIERFETAARNRQSLARLGMPAGFFVWSRVAQSFAVIGDAQHQCFSVFFGGNRNPSRT